jgi:cytochrome b involved in lipid metabolism
MSENMKDNIGNVHNEKRVIIYAHGNAYDVTNYLNCHPGGSQCLKNKNGEDCSRDYDFHRGHGKKIWKKHKIKGDDKNNCVIM